MDWTFTTDVHEIRKALGDEAKPHRYVETGVKKDIVLLVSSLIVIYTSKILSRKPKSFLFLPNIPNSRLLPIPNRHSRM